jgi:uncharacterized protein YhbP (UPF0306 family)
VDDYIEEVAFNTLVSFSIWATFTFYMFSEQESLLYILEHKGSKNVAEIKKIKK